MAGSLDFWVPETTVSWPAGRNNFEEGVDFVVVFFLSLKPNKTPVEKFAQSKYNRKLSLSF